MRGVAKATEVLCTCHLQRKNRIMDTLSENLVGNNYEFVILVKAFRQCFVFTKHVKRLVFSEIRKRNRLKKDASYNVVAKATEVLRTNHLLRK